MKKNIAIGYNFITKEEKKIMTSLVNAYNLYIKLEVQHPGEQLDFTNGIHMCQKLLSIRVARKAEPKMFAIKIKHK